MYTIDSPVGMLYAQISAKGINRLSYTTILTNQILYCENADKIYEELKLQLNEYFTGNRKSFNLPLDISGSEFKLNVWRQLLSIPFGKTASYKQQAIQINKPAAVRAVAAACGKNPVMIIIPCHRIIASDLKLTGYAGGLEAKKWLLNHESRQINLFI